MAATAAATDIGSGMTFARKTGASTYAVLAEVTDFTLPEASRDSVEFTHFTSPDRHREFKPGLIDPGEAGIVYNLIPGGADDAVIATHLGLTTGRVEGWRIVFPNGATLDFNGFATRHGRAAPLEDKMTGSATFKVSGKPVLTPGV